MTLLLGLDVGSSSIKTSLIEAETGKTLASAVSPERELEIIAPQIGWAEQHPDTWWEHVKKSTQKIRTSMKSDVLNVEGIGISYQMHGLVIVDKSQKVLYPSVI